MRYRLYLLAAALLWSTSGAAIKNCSLNGVQIAFARSLVAGLVLFLAFKEARIRPTLRIFLVGLAYAATVVLFVIATKATTSANAIFLQDTAPLWVLLWSPLILKERASKSELLAVPVFLGGLALFFLDQLTPSQVTGNLIALASGVAFSLCIVGLRLVKSEGAAATAWGNLIAAAVTLPFIFKGPSPTSLDFGLVLFLGIFQLGIPYALFAKGVTHVPAVEASLLILLEPVLNPVWTFFAAGERPGKFAIMGGAVILAATLWKTFTPSKANEVVDNERPTN
ncbi:MAG: DMT family transporter [Myxococcaceae bacterium]